jgi:hypothetical protein
MAKYIYVWDERVNQLGWSPVTKRGENNVMLIKVTATDPMNAIVNRILGWTEPAGLLVLRILAHGYVQPIPDLPWGVTMPPIGLGHGELGAEGLNAAMIAKWAALKGKFEPFSGRVELHNCALADPNCQTSLTSNARCSDWLEKLADAIDAPVVAAEQIQRADDAWNYEGPTRTYWPKRMRDQQAAVGKLPYGWGR